MGVEVRLDELVQDISTGLIVTNKRTLRTHNIIWAAGVGGHPLAGVTGGPLDRAGKVQVDPTLAVPGQPTIFCLGDMASLPGRDGHPLPGVASVAMQQGKHAAQNICRQIDGKRMRAFRYFDKGSMATIGRKSAVAVLPGGITLSGWPAWLGWLAVHLTYLADLQNRLMVLLRWGWAYLGWKWNARLIMSRSFESSQSPSLTRPELATSGK